MYKKGLSALKALLCICLLVLMAGTASAQSFFSVKYKTEQPVFTGGGTDEIADSTDFHSGSYKEVFYASPSDKKFNVSISALVNEDNEVDQIKGFLGWGGIATFVSVGEINGTFTPTNTSTILPSAWNASQSGKTVLPSEKSFSSESRFFGVGIGDEGITMGVGYLDYQSPVSIWIETTDSTLYPGEIVDAYWRTEMYGYWMKMDFLQAVAEDSSSAPVLKYFNNTEDEKLGVGFGADILMGFIRGTHGENVIADYKTAAPALDLQIEDVETLGIRISYDVGIFYVKKINTYQLLLNAGVEGMIMNDFDLDDPNPDFGGNSSAAYGEKFNDSSKISYSYYVRCGFTY